MTRKTVSAYKICASHPARGSALKLQALLDLQPLDSAYKRIALEMLIASHATRMGSKEEADNVADTIHKHVRQIIGDWFGGAT